ncbi:hypothetical protein IAU60_004776 [Kwoniella sp. DSM 27419]
MPSQLPSTPWTGSTRFADESLLLEARPIFGDVTLGDLDQSMDWDDVTNTSTPRARPCTPKRVTPRRVDPSPANESLDLGDYLPEDEGSHPDGPGPTLPATTAGPSCPPPRLIAELTTSSERKRDRSDSPLDDGTGAKKRKPPSTLQVTSPGVQPPPALLPAPTAAASTPEPRLNVTDNSHTSSSAFASGSRAPSPPALHQPFSSDMTTASTRLKRAIQFVARDEAISQTIESETEQRDSACLTPNTKSDVQPAISTNSESLRMQPGPDLEVQTDANTASVPTHPWRSVSTLQTEAINWTAQPPTNTPAQKGLGHSPASTRVASPTPSHSSTASSSLRLRLVTPPSDTPTIQHPSHTGAARVSPANSTRRESMSEKVVGFFSSLLRASVSSGSLAQDADAAPRGSSPVDGSPGKTTASLEVEHPAVEEEETSVTDQARQRPASGRNGASGTTGARSTRLPPGFIGLTRPVAFSRPLHIREEKRPVATGSGSRSTQPVRPIDPTAQARPRLPTVTRQPLQPTRSQNVASSAAVASRAGNAAIDKSVRRPATGTAFTKAALARLPSPGKGATPSARPTKVREIERASNLADRKSVFERLAAASSARAATNSKPSSGPSAGGLKRTVPIVGHTPGKASSVRAAQRAKFDEARREKMGERERAVEEVRRKKEAEEQERYLQSRKETVIWAKPVPGIYHRPEGA